MDLITIIGVALVAVAGGVVFGFMWRKATSEKSVGSAEARAKELVVNAEREAESLKKEAHVEARDEALRIRNEAEVEAKQKSAELQQREQRLLKREETLDERERKLDSKERSLADREANVERAREKVEAHAVRLQADLERVASMTAAEAKQSLIEQIEEEAKRESMAHVREMEAQAREEAERRARKIVSIAIQRVASEETSETSQSVVTLPNDDMKGRIIGREGRNIRAFEAATGTNLIIDDTPESVVLSCFDPIRREIARITLEKLISDGRIQPARIEETAAKARKEVDSAIQEAGEWAIMEVGITDMHPELVKVLGRLNYRTSYGQNVLKHLVEASHIAGAIAAELGTDIDLAKRCTLLHDIGKAVTHEIEGSHAIIGAELARRLKESPDVVHAIESHHGEVEQKTVEAVIAQTADAISGSRPGARRETLETYVKRLERLEGIAESFEGVEKAYAMQGGREVRVMVKPQDVDDLRAEVIARDVAKKIEEELQYPGQIKVMVIRELRAEEYAK